MTQTLAVTTAITNLNQAHQRLNLNPASQADFFLSGRVLYQSYAKKKPIYLTA